MSGSEILYIVEMDLPDANLREFIQWYAGAHVPHLHAGGFASCISYRAVVGGPSIVDFYQAPETVFTAEAYRAYRKVAASDPHRPKAVNASPTMFTVYLASPEAPDAAAERDRLVDADWISIVRFPSGNDRDARLGAWLRAEGLGALRALGAGAIRHVRRTKDAPAGTSDRPDGALVVEWPARPPRAVETGSAFPAWLGLGADDIFVGFRLYPWPLDGALLGLADVPGPLGDRLPAHAGKA